MVKQFVVYFLCDKSASGKEKYVCFSICTIVFLVLLELGAMEGRGEMAKDYVSPEKAMLREHLQWGIICCKSVILPEDRICSHN